MAKKYTSKYTGQEIDAGIDKVPVLEGKLTELESEVNYILNGEDTSNIITETYQGDGKGNGYASFLVVDNLTDKFGYKLIAETDLTYVSTDGATHDFISLCNTSAGSTTSLSPFAEKRGSVGDVIAAGTIVHEGVFTPSLASAVFVRTRMSGSVRLEYYIGEKAEKDVTYDELKENVKRNNASILSNTQQLSSQAAKLNSVEASVSSTNTKIENLDSRLDELDGEQPDVYSASISGDGVGASTIREKVVSSVNGLFIYRLVAVTDLIYTSSDGAEHTFVDIVSYPTGTTAPTSLVSELRGNVGDTISAGTVVHEGSTTFDSAVDIWVRSRMIGSVKLEYSFSYGSDGIRDIVNKQSATIDNHETRIQELESVSPIEDTIIYQYRQQINRALQLGYVETRAVADWPTKPLVFLHISDTHALTNNNRAFEVLNYLGSKGNVQFLMHTGDILEDPKNASQNRWASAVAAAIYPVMITPGNHDVGNWATASGQYTTSVQFHNTFISPIISKWGLKTDGGGIPYTDGKNYYFKDFTDQKIRFIVVDEYELPNQYNTDGVTLLAGRGARWISQEQANWFIESLSTTPSGYGVIVAKHAPDGKRGEDANAFNSRYLKGKDHQQSYQYVGGTNYTTFFADIVQAFIDRTSINKIVNQSAGGIVADVVVNADFTDMDSEFICYVSGHTHADGINFLKDYPKQLDLNINCDNTFYQHYSNLNLIAGTMYEDAINAYSVDRNRGVIHVVRIGGEYSADGDRRDLLTIDYRNKNFK